MSDTKKTKSTSEPVRMQKYRGRRTAAAPIGSLLDLLFPHQMGQKGKFLHPGESARRRVLLGKGKGGEKRQGEKKSRALG